MGTDLGEGKHFIKRAGTYIVGVSIIIWFFEYAMGRYGKRTVLSW